ncbi:DEAD/DEAH box helicase [Liquorilactobacillus ghanensis]|uniref:DEAD/DEAH box helicase n=1 Tax=Liquorilactobacillus ghanensis TaxID=399370 RepID=UPI0039E73877
MQLEDFYGRLVKVAGQENVAYLPATAKKISAIEITGKYIICHRCNQKTNKQLAFLPNGNYYCPQCIQFGRLTSQDLLYTIAEPNRFPLQTAPLTWSGKLSALQQGCAVDLQLQTSRKKDFLLWAVTGAGKTEILFPTIAAALKRRERICIATPRIDVCNELYPRLSAAFKQTSMVLLHGSSSMDYRYSQIVICTTHQLLKFKNAFDLLIIDEADAFPFKGNRLLQTAVTNARKKISSLLLLTATPTSEMLRKVKQHQLKLGYLPLRFHGHLLPVPQIILLPSWKKQLQRQKLAQNIIRPLQKWLQAGWPILVFAPQISLLELLKTSLKQFTTNQHLTTVFAADPHRIEKVQQMREESCQLLITTTILERGVTFPKLNVLVIGADEPVFTEEALVQIAGRAGRSSQRPVGEVIFACSMLNRNLSRALRQIKFLNHEGAKLNNNALSKVPTSDTK